MRSGRSILFYSLLILLLQRFKHEKENLKEQIEELELNQATGELTKNVEHYKVCFTVVLLRDVSQMSILILS